jgi:hypothetical protein
MSGALADLRITAEPRERLDRAERAVKKCSSIELRRRDKHEAGHAVFMWRNSDRYEQAFDEILISPYAVRRRWQRSAPGLGGRLSMRTLDVRAC